MSHHSSGLARSAMTVLQPGFAGTEPPTWLRRALADEGLGGTVLFARNLPDPARTAGLVARLRAENPAVVIAVDEEGGAVTRLQATTGSSWPGNRALGVGDDVELTRLVAREIGHLLRTAGITLDYAPVADVDAGPHNPVIGVRSFGSDPGLVSRHTAAWVCGLQETGVAACAKHFPGHGGTVTDSHRALPTVHASLRLLAERDLPPFRAAVSAGVRAIMCGHLLVPALDPDRPATSSRRIMSELLREELGFDGMIVTDAIEMRAVAARHSPGEIAVRALVAGADAICAGVSSPDGRSVYALRDAIVDAVREGRLPEERLAEAAARVLALSAWHARNGGNGGNGDDAAARAGAGGEGRAGAGTGWGAGGVESEELGLRTARAALRVIVRDASSGPLGQEPSGQGASGSRLSGPVPEAATGAEVRPGRGPMLSAPPLVVAIALRGDRTAAPAPVDPAERAGADPAEQAGPEDPAEGAGPEDRAGHAGPAEPLAEPAAPTEAISLTAIADALAEVLPGTVGHTVTARAPRLPGLGGPERPLVLVVHDVRLHPWAGELLARALALRPDAVVVETGLPGEPAGAVYVTTNGFSRASARVLARRLTGGE
ncbi:glycoside hydrolase family 3 protein [Streptosporangium sp. NPDC050855]|uniref:glycoside hydrolase family 3 protein n=1 Tax=Streptosporangium sp. NPDC050855 TaxID=3366194 RepID=UPI0037941733